MLKRTKVFYGQNAEKNKSQNTASSISTILINNRDNRAATNPSYNGETQRIERLLIKIKEANPDYKVLTKEGLNVKLFKRIKDARELDAKYTAFLKMELRNIIAAKEINDDKQQDK